MSRWQRVSFGHPFRFLFTEDMEKSFFSELCSKLGMEREERGHRIGMCLESCKDYAVYDMLPCCGGT
jgi:hypothetical protein